VIADEELAQYLSEPLRHPFYGVELISPEQLTEAEATTIPRWWIDSHNGADPVATALAAWEAAIPGKLPRVTREIRASVRTVKLCRATMTESGSTAIVIAYIFDQSDASHFDVGYGLEPVREEDRHRFTAGIEPGFEAFYTTVQNGFFQDHPFGLMPAQRMQPATVVGERDDFEYLIRTADGYAALPESEWPDLNQLVAVCLDVAGNAVTLDVGDGDGRAWELWDNGFERVEGTVWDSIDRWLARLLGV
jgi:hypothetical protein